MPRSAGHLYVGPRQMAEFFEYRRFRIGTIIALAYTAIFALSDVSWTWASENDAVFSSLLSLSALLFVCGIPYTGLLRLLKRSPTFPRFQCIAFCLMVALPLLLLPGFKISGVATAGWQYFLIPFWQLVLYGVLSLVFKILVAVDRRRSSRLGI